MDHADHVGLIRDGVPPFGSQEPEPGGPRWLELGAGEGAFTLALADILGPGASITAIDRDARALRRLTERVDTGFPGRNIATIVQDFRDALPAGPFDGVLAANSLHFVEDPIPVLRAIAAVLPATGRLVIVEYDADRGNPWVPHPFSSTRFTGLATEAGFVEPREIGRVPSRFLGAIYGAVAIRP